ncbi:MAG: hypothetical protein A2Z51_09215 [Deltaproteobacteria bacterium RBG_19FT_COMBO_52_11]|jgi:hypothetical protein|nr:MAG: hypothetical protein A2Z51_09215 [Deltaproteobacteria bacterium RBG_19FT_COMBO_52_11]
MDKENQTDIKGWLIILALAFLFICWGLFTFFTVGDKGPPSWDFGVVRDIPGESPYSTQRDHEGKDSEPQPQHVAEKPSPVTDK